MADFELIDAFVHVDDEDSLTKAVFGCFELLSVEALNRILAEATLGLEFVAEPVVTFHETIDRREPDVVLDDAPHLTLMVEAKLGAPTETRQLVDEYADLADTWNSDQLYLLHVTDDNRPPRALENISEIPESALRWTSWRKLAAAIQKCDSSRLSGTDQRVLDMVSQLLAENGFEPFGGFTLMTDEDSFTAQLQTAYDVRETYYGEVDAFRRDTESQIGEDIEFWRFFRRGVRGGMQDGHSGFPQKSYQRIPKHLWFGYIPRGQPPQLANKKYLQNYLTLDFNSRTGTIRAGYVVTTASGRVEEDVFRKSVHGNRETVLRVIDEHDLQPYTTSFSLTTRRDSPDGIREFLDKIGDPGYDASEYGKRFMIAKTWSGEDLPTKQEGDQFEEVPLPAAVAAAIEEIYELTFNEYDHIFYPASG